MSIDQNQVVSNIDSDNKISDASECELSNVVKDTVDDKIQDECFTQSNMEEVNSTFAKPAPTAFKKPVVLIGPRKDKCRKLHTVLNIGPKLDKDTANVYSAESVDSQPKDTSLSEETSKFDNDKPDVFSGVLQKDKQIPIPYNEPSWSGLPDKVYKMEVLKSGVILETIDLTKKSFHIFGRLPLCDVPLTHPTISRYHAILQYRSIEDKNNAKGMYLYDLGSTHGTFWNGNRIRPNVYVRLHGSHMIRFGCSQRKFILQAPHDDEEECELSVTELKERRKLELEERERKEKEFRLEVEAMEKLRQEKEEREGIDWGMGEDADEETDLTENPYAFSNNEELFLDDPKKTLRGWFEREGYELQYQTEEKGIGQFLCWVELPIDNATGRTVKAEALVKGKKKESVIQCALEACRILDRHGLLRQANHEGRKRKARNWEEEDYYDSDEDNFLDRTGVIEKKREQRMRTAGKLNTAVETYSSLVRKHKEIVKEISNIKDRLQHAQKIKQTKVAENENEDALDAFMSNLNLPVLNKSDISKLKLKLQELCSEEERLISLVNIAKPVNLPPLTLRASMDIVDKKEKDSEKVISTVGHKKKCKGMAVKSETKTSTDSTILSTTNKQKKYDDNEVNEVSVCKKDIVNKKLNESHESELTMQKDKCNTILPMEVQTTVKRHVEEESTIILDKDLSSIESKKAVIEETKQSKSQPLETDKKEVVKKKK